MPRKKKTTPAEDFTPHDLNSLHAQTQRIVGRASAVRESEEAVKSKNLIKNKKNYYYNPYNIAHLADIVVGVNVHHPVW